MLMGNVKVTRLHYHWMLFLEVQCEPNCSSPVLFIIIFLTATWLHSPTPPPRRSPCPLSWPGALQVGARLLMGFKHETLKSTWYSISKSVCLGSGIMRIRALFPPPPPTLLTKLWESLYFPLQLPSPFFLLFFPLLSTFSLCWWQSKGFPHSVSLGEWLSDCS